MGRDHGNHAGHRRGLQSDRHAGRRHWNRYGRSCGLRRWLQRRTGFTGWHRRCRRCRRRRGDRRSSDHRGWRRRNTKLLHCLPDRSDCGRHRRTEVRRRGLRRRSQFTRGRTNARSGHRVEPVTTRTNSLPAAQCGRHDIVSHRGFGRYQPGRRDRGRRTWPHQRRRIPRRCRAGQGSGSRHILSAKGSGRRPDGDQFAGRRDFGLL